MVHKLTKLLQWEAPEFVFKEKKPDWYWALGIIVIGFFIIAILDRNFPLAILVLLAGGMLFFFAQKKPDDVSVEISDQGIKINKQFYPYQNLKSFWIYEKEDLTWQLVIHVRRTVNPAVTLPVDENIQPDRLREVLLTYLPEEEHEEPLSYQLSDRIGL